MNVKWIPAVVAGCMLSQLSWASTFSAANTASGQAFVSACAGSQDFGGAQNPGASVFLPQPSSIVNCDQVQGTLAATPVIFNSGPSPVSEFPGATFTDNTSMSATPGLIRFAGTVTGESVDIEAGAAGDGGWNDSFIWTGATGIWRPQFFVDATMSSTATVSGGGEAVLEIAMVDNTPNPYNYLTSGAYPAAYNQFVNPTINPQTQFGDTNVGVDYEVAIWTADYKDQVLDVNDTITFAIPVTHGQAVNYGFYLSYMVTTGDGCCTSSDLTPTTETIDPQVGYLDPGTLLTGENQTVPVVASDFSGGNLNYAGVPEPGAAILTLAGLSLCLLGLRRKRTDARSRALATRRRPF